MKNRTIIILIVVVIILAAGAYWYFFMGAPGLNNGTSTNTEQGGQTGFQPLGRTVPFGGGGNNATGTSTGNQTNNQGYQTPAVLPTLRMLSGTPVGGYGASTTASTTVVRWIDRGRGNVYEASEDSSFVNTLSNTVVPRMYWSVWNKNLTAFIGSLFQDGDTAPTTVYAGLVAQATSTAASTTADASSGATLAPYELRGKNLPASVVSYAVSPKGDRVFFFAIQNGRGVGYTAPFNGGTITEIFDTPVTQVNVDWPETNTIAITTKGSASSNGYLYFVDPKTGIWKKVVGPLPGLSAKVSRDAKYVILSAAGNSSNVLTSIYSVDSSSGIDAIVRTLADKCAWGNFYKELVYCAVPYQPVSGTYPDDWYRGTLSTMDKIWQVNAKTGSVKLVSSVIDQSNRVIDAFNLGLDAKDNYLFFMNKNDLSLWSLDLVRAQ